MTSTRHRKATHRIASTVAAAALLALVPATVSADDKAKWSNGHKIENKDKGYSVKFGGRVMADFAWNDEDESLGSTEDGFEFRRARLFFSGTVYDRVEFKVNYDFAGGDADFKDVWIAFKHDWGKIKIGHYKEHFSMEELASSKNITFLERSLPVAAFAPSRSSGVGIDGKRGDTFNWGIGYYYDADGFGISTSEDNTNLTGHVGFRPIYDNDGETLIHVGLSASQKSFDGTTRVRTRPENHFTGRYVDTGTFAADDALLYGVEFATVHGPFWTSGEYISYDVDSSAAGDPTFDGFYVQAGYFLTGEARSFKTSAGVFDRIKPNNNWGDNGAGAWEIAGRYSTVDLSDGAIEGGEEDNYSIGLNWYPNPVTRMMLNYVNADVDGEGSADFVLLRWQIDF